MDFAKRSIGTDRLFLLNLGRLRRNLTILPAVQNLYVHSLIEDIDFGISKLPRAHTPLEEQIELSKRTASRLRDAEVGVNNAAEAQTGPEEAGEILPNIDASTPLSLVRGLFGESLVELTSPRPRG